MLKSYTTKTYTFVFAWEVSKYTRMFFYVMFLSISFLPRNSDFHLIKLISKHTDTYSKCNWISIFTSLQYNLKE